MFGKFQKGFNKVSKLAQEHVDSDIVEQVTGKITELDEFRHVNWMETISTLKKSGKECRQLALETSEMCTETASKGQQMVDFGAEVQATLNSFVDETTTRGVFPDASVLDTIQDLTDGDRIREAMALAKDMDEIAINCVNKSVEMIDLMEETMNSLPTAVQRTIREQAESQEDEELEEKLKDLMDVDQPVQDIQDCISALSNLNLATALQVGSSAFQQLSTKADLSKTIFEYVRTFANDIEKALHGFEDLDMSNVRTNSKTLLRCIRLSGFMRKLSHGVKTLIEIMVDLFQATADRISTLWEALAFCKKIMYECMEDVNQTKTLCLDAQDRGNELLEKSNSIKDQLESIGDLNRKSFAAVCQLTESGAIQQAVELAQNMDDRVVECAGKAVHMITRVTEAFTKIPDIITQGLDLSESGTRDDDPKPRAIDDDLVQLDTTRGEIESANIIEVAKAGYKSFSDVSGTVDICKEMLTLVFDFATNCNEVIEEFMGAWNLDSAMDKIEEMCRIVRLGEMKKKSAERIIKLLQSTIELMTTTSRRLDVNYDDLQDELEDAVTENIVDSVTDKLEDKIGSEMAGKVGETLSHVADNLGDVVNGELGDAMGELGNQMSDKLGDVEDVMNKFKKFW